ncbi:cell division protein FtsB [Hydrogenophaga aquatica]
MGARFVAALLLVLLGSLHVQLWWGRGSVPQVNALRQDLAEQEKANAEARQRNEQLASEVRDLREGLDMVEEMARHELGMVKPNEIFVQVAKPKP